jgi:hypothetical protein
MKDPHLRRKDENERTERGETASMQHVASSASSDPETSSKATSCFPVVHAYLAPHAMWMEALSGRTIFISGREFGSSDESRELSFASLSFPSGAMRWCTIRWGPSVGNEMVDCF